MGIESRRAGPVLTDEPIYRDQALADGIDGKEETFKSDGAEQRRTVGSNEARSSDFIAIQSQSCLRYGPYLSLSAGDHDALGASRLQLKPFRQRPRHHAQSSAGVHKKLNVFDMSCRAGQMSLDVKKSHLNSLSKTCCIVA